MKGNPTPFFLFLKKILIDCGRRTGISGQEHRTTPLICTIRTGGSCMTEISAGHVSPCTDHARGYDRMRSDLKKKIFMGGHPLRRWRIMPCRALI
jgi:hypothetical protein